MTGIILRKNTADYFETHLPREGEIVYATDTQKVGSMEIDNDFGLEVVVWQDWGYQVPDEILTTGTTSPSNEDGSDGDKYIMTEFVPAMEYKEISVNDTGTWVGDWDSSIVETPNYLVLSLPKGSYGDPGKIIWFNKSDKSVFKIIDGPNDRYWGYYLCYSDGILAFAGVDKATVEVYNEQGDFIRTISGTYQMEIESLAIDSNYIYIGNPWSNDRYGIVNIYTREGVEVTAIHTSTEQYGEFGMSISVDDRYLVVSATREDTANGSGVIYILDISDFSLITRIPNPLNSSQWLGYGTIALDDEYFYATNIYGTNTLYKFSYDGVLVDSRTIGSTSGNTYPFRIVINDENIVVVGKEDWDYPEMFVFDKNLAPKFSFPNLYGNKFGHALSFYNDNRLLFLTSSNDYNLFYEYQIGGLEEGYITREFKKESSTWREMSQGASLEFIEETFSTDTNAYLGQRNDYHMDVGYVPTFANDVATKGYLASKLAGVGGLDAIKLDGSDSEMDEDYVAVGDRDILTKKTLLQGDMNYFVPDNNPFFDGVLWNDNGVLKISSDFIKIIASDSGSADLFGRSVSINDNKIVVGAPHEDSAAFDAGTIYIYDLDGSNEVKITASDASSGAQFGHSVNCNSTKIVVGSRDDSVYVYNLDGSGEVKFTSTDGVVESIISISESKIVVGSQYDDVVTSNTGSVYVFDLDGTNEVKVTASDPAVSDYFGSAVGINNSKIVVGAPYDDNENGSDAGSVYVFDLDGTNEVKIIASDGASSDRFGNEVYMTNTKIVVSANGDDNENGTDAGAVYVYDIDGTNEVKIIASDGVGGEKFGSSVTINENKVFIGVEGDNENGTDAGAVYVYDIDGTNEVKIIASDGAGGDRLGNSIDINSNTMIVGASFDDTVGGSDAGSVYLFPIR